MDFANPIRHSIQSSPNRHTLCTGTRPAQRSHASSLLDENWYADTLEWKIHRRKRSTPCSRWWTTTPSFCGMFWDEFRRRKARRGWRGRWRRRQPGGVEQYSRWTWSGHDLVVFEMHSRSQRTLRRTISRSSSSASRRASARVRPARSMRSSVRATGRPRHLRRILFPSTTSTRCVERCTTR